MLPKHLSVEILFQINQIIGFILLPSMYLILKMLSFIWVFPFNLTLISLVGVYIWILFDCQAPLYFVKFNSWVLSQKYTQVWLHRLLCFEDFIIVFNKYQWLFILVIPGFVFMFFNGDPYESIVAYIVIWVISLYLRMRFKYLNKVQLEMSYKNDYSIPDWGVLVNHLDRCFHLEFNKFQQRLGDQEKPYLYHVKNRIKDRTRPYLFLASRSFASNPEMQKLAVEAFKTAVKTNNEGAPLALSILTLGVAVTAILISQHTQHKIAKENGVREDKKIAIQQQKVNLEQLKLNLEEAKLDIARENQKLQARKLVSEETNNHDLKTKQIVSDAIGPYINKKQQSQLGEQELSRIADILSKKVNQSSSSSSLLD
jgi:hypothetical protein